MTTYATLFDSNFLIRGATCVRSIARQSSQPCRFLVLALDDQCKDRVASVVGSLPENMHLDVLGLAELEMAWPDLAVAKANRSRIEYYFTLTPFLCQEAIKRVSPGEYVIYVDADFYFFADPELVVAECDGKPIAITEHRYTPPLAHLSELYGRFNVGILAFSSSSTAVACLKDWSEKCLTWCKDAPEDGKFGDQKYLDDWPTSFPDLCIIPHEGVNAAPWNVGCFDVEGTPQGPAINGRQLIAYHFHHLIRRDLDLYEADFHGFLTHLSEQLIRQVYAPYVAALCQLERDHTSILASRASVLHRFNMAPPSIFHRLWRYLLKVRRTLRRERVIFRNGVPLGTMAGAFYE